MLPGNSISGIIEVSCVSKLGKGEDGMGVGGKNVDPIVNIFGHDSHAFGSNGSLPRLTSILDGERL